MSKAFFTGWALWQKLVFVLASAMAVTVLLGCLKLLYSRRRLRHYAAVADQSVPPPPVTVEAPEGVPIMHDIEARPLSYIPFGIRAIESGVEIEGVWTSPSATPSTRGSQDSLPYGSWRQSLHVGSSETVGQQSNSSVAHARMVSEGGSSSTGSVSTTVGRNFGARGARTASFDAQFLAETEASLKAFMAANSSQSSSEHPMPTKVSPIPRPTLPPPQARIGLIDFSQIGKSALARTGPNFRHSASTLESVATHGPPSSKLRQSYQIYDSEDSNNDESGDLGLLNRHRLNHTASTGYLLPRTRQASEKELESESSKTPAELADGPTSSEWPSTDNIHLRSSFSTHSVMPINVIPPSPSRPHSQAAVLVTPDLPAMQPSPQSHRVPEPLPEPVPELTKRPKTKRPFSFTASVRLPSPRPPVQRAVSSTSVTPSKPDVARVVNSGFEILKPGSLTTQSSLVDPETRGRKEMLDEKISGHGQKKLQKKKRREGSSLGEVLSSRIEKVWTK